MKLKSVLFVFLLAGSLFSYKSNFDTVGVNRIAIKRVDTSHVPVFFMVRDSGNDTAKFFPFDSIGGVTPDSVGKAGYATTAGSVHHGIAPMHFGTGKTATTFYSTEATYDSTTGNATFPNNFYLGGTTRKELMFGGWNDSNLLCISPYGTYNSTFAPYDLFFGNKHTSLRGYRIIQSGDSGGVIIDGHTGIKIAAPEQSAIDMCFNRSINFCTYAQEDTNFIINWAVGGTLLRSENSPLQLAGTGGNPGVEVTEDTTTINNIFDIDLDSAGSVSQRAKRAIDGTYHIRTYAELLSFKTAMGSSKADWKLDLPITPTENCTLPENLNLANVLNTGHIMPSAYNLHIMKQSCDPMFHIFDTAANVTYGAGAVPHVRSEWWGVSTASIKSAIAATPRGAKIVLSDSVDVSGPIVFPDSISLEISGGLIRCLSDTVKIYSKFNASLVRIFGAGTFCFGKGSLTTVYPCWWPGGYPGTATDTNTNAIQNAINSVSWYRANTSQSMTNYARVQLLDGVYHSGQLYIRPNVYFTGTNPQNTNLTVLNGLNDDLIVFKYDIAGAPWIDGAIIENMTLDGNKANNTYGCGIRTQAHGDTTVQLKLSNETYFRNLVIKNFPNDGIKIDGLALPFFLQSVFFMNNDRYGVNYKPASGISQIAHFLNVSADGNDSGGIFLDNTSGDGGEIFQFTSCKFEHNILNHSATYNPVTNPDRQRSSIIIRNGNGASVLINGVSTHDGMRSYGIPTATAQVLLKGTSRPAIVTWSNLRCTMPNDTTPVLVDSVGSVVRIPNSAINGSYNGGAASTKSIYGMYGNQDFMIGDTTGLRPISGYAPLVSMMGVSPIQIKKLQGFNDNTKNIGTYCDKFTHASDTEVVATATTIDTLGVHRAGVELRWRKGAGAYLWNNYFTKARFSGSVVVGAGADTIVSNSTGIKTYGAAKLTVGNTGTPILNMHYRDSTFVIMTSATDSICLRRVLP